jgi:hypothetical protein
MTSRGAPMEAQWPVAWWGGGLFLGAWGGLVYLLARQRQGDAVGFLLAVLCFLVLAVCAGGDRSGTGH